MTFTLRPYQIKLINDTIIAIKKGYKSILIQSPTGSGKTVIFSYIAEGAIKKGNKVLILTHRREILQQTVDKLKGFKLSPSTITSGKKIDNNPLHVAMIGTLVNRLSDLPAPDLIIIDECQHSVSNTWNKVITHFDCLKLGFSATPERLSGEGLGEIFEYMVMGPTVKELVNIGSLSTPRMFCAPEVEEKPKIKMTRGDYDKDEQEKIFRKKTITGSVIGHYKKYLNGLPAICFCVSIKHCHFMEDQFSQAGYKASTIHGGMNKKDRDNCITGLKDGRLNILCSCDVISEGVDIPVVAGAIMLRRTKSLALYLQQAGRALRVYPGKKEAIILDHCGVIYEHGHILQNREWSLEAARRSKRDAVSMPIISVCPKCSGVWPGHPEFCPDCGFNLKEERDRKEGRKPPREIEGILREVLPGREIDQLVKRVVSLQEMDPGQRHKKMIGELYRRGDCQEVRAMARALDYKNGWTHVMSSKLRRR